MKYGLFMSTDLAGLTLKFDGPATDDHSMTVSDLAPSLMAWGKAVEIVREYAAPESQKVRLRVQADSMRAGSFIIDIFVELPGFLEQAKLALTGKTATSVVNASTIAGLLLGGVKVATIPISRRHEAERNKRRDDELIDRIANDPRFQAATLKATKPLEQPGFTEISLATAGGDLEAPVTAESRGVLQGKFDEVEAKPVGTTVTEMVVKLHDHSWDANGEWIVDDGDSKYTARMADEDFQRRTDANEIGFFKDDMFRIQMQTVQSITRAGTLKNKRTILKVLGHHSPNQQPLF